MNKYGSFNNLFILQEPTTPNVLTTEVKMTAFTEVEGTQILPETVNPAVTSTKPDVFTTRGKIQVNNQSELAI